MAGIQYNGAIEVRPCKIINIPQPGILMAIFPDVAMTYNRTNDPAVNPTITGVPTDVMDRLIANNVGGGDVIYGEFGEENGSSIYEIISVNPATSTIVLRGAVGFTPCQPGINDAPGDTWSILKIYRGNYSPTTGLQITVDGYTGAGNSEGYSLLGNNDGTVTVLTVDNNLLTVELKASVPLDLQVVKVLNGNDFAPGSLYALRVQQ